MTKLIYSIISLAIFTACSSTQITNRSSFQKLFPNGSYEHIVTIKTPKNQYKINGVAKITDNNLKIVALSNFYTTLLKLEKQKGSPLKVIYIDKSFSKFEDKLENIFENIFSIFTLSYANKRKTYFEKKVKDQVVGISISSPDQNKIPQKIILENKNFKIIINISKYKLTRL